MRTLVVCFSRGGNTRQVAQEIAARRGADLEMITEPGTRNGVWGYLRSVWQSLTRATPPIHAGSLNPADYDLVIIGTPVWAQRVASPVRAYVQGQARQFKQIAFFCTEGGSGARSAFDELRHLCRQEPVATLVLTQTELSSGSDHAPQVKRFVAGLAMG